MLWSVLGKKGCFRARRRGKERKGAKKVSTLVDADQSYYAMPEREKEALGWGALGKQYCSMG